MNFPNNLEGSSIYHFMILCLVSTSITKVHLYPLQKMFIVRTYVIHFLRTYVTIYIYIYIYIYIIAEVERKWIPTIKEVVTNRIIADTFHLKKAIHYIVLQRKYCLTVMVYIFKKKIFKNVTIKKP